jgi:hypothetical protein
MNHFFLSQEKALLFPHAIKPSEAQIIERNTTASEHLPLFSLNIWQMPEVRNRTLLETR